ncbi:MAG: hypothetical protein KF774_13120 [Planctomyces sp.]|nr:hypothetical protein [Planctomyces sp.]
MPGRPLFTALLCLTAAARLMAAEDASTPLVAEGESLLARLPAVDTSTPGAAPFTATAEIDFPGRPARVFVWFGGGERVAWRVEDATDGTPMLAASGRRLFVYDPVRPVLLHNSDAAIRFKLSGRGGELRFDVAVTNSPEQHSSLDLDLGSLLDKPGGELQVVANEESRFQLARISPTTGNRMVATMNPEGVVTIELREVDLDRPRLAIRYEPGVPPDAAFQLPSLDELGEVPLLSIEGAESVLGKAEVAGLLIRSVAVHAACAIPELRAELPLLGNLDWDRLAANESRVSERLRQAFQRSSDVTPGPARQAEGAAAPMR